MAATAFSVSASAEIPRLHPIAAFLQTLRDLLADFGAQHPWSLFLAIAILPGFGFPVSLLVVLAGAIWPTAPWLSVLIALAALGLNMIWTHFVASGPAGSRIRTLLPDRWSRLFTLRAENHFRLACILRLTPGIPFFVQNYALGLCGVPLRHSLAIGLPINILYVAGFVLTGGAIFEGKLGLALAGIGLLVAVGLALRIRASRKPAALPEADL